MYIGPWAKGLQISIRDYSALINRVCKRCRITEAKYSLVYNLGSRMFLVKTMWCFHLVPANHVAPSTTSKGKLVPSLSSKLNILLDFDTKSIKRSSKSFEELPPSPTAATALSLSSFALTFSGDSPLIDSAIAFPNSAESGTPSAPSHTFTPMPMYSTNSLAFTNWSAFIGQLNIKTPPTIPSSTEFHPQWLRNPPTARWPRIITCGAQPFISNPLPATLSSNPSGTTPDPSFTFPAKPVFTTHTNRAPLCSSPEAKASICCLFSNV
ncbi:hypothetical protein DVH24_007315 [Malus domestica]|uniref:Uncharacterized protein n=1 Tax=Malus domestica TaxID=3750 RepID=A0A498HGC6_MALDO|nr:hypothetical protein DVH24_007315 [Malus domestica]